MPLDSLALVAHEPVNHSDPIIAVISSSVAISFGAQHFSDPNIPSDTSNCDALPLVPSELSGKNPQFIVDLFGTNQAAVITHSTSDISNDANNNIIFWEASFAINK